MESNSKSKYITLGLAGTLVVGISHLMFSGHMGFLSWLFMIFLLVAMVMGYVISFIAIYPREGICFRLIKQGLSKEDTLQYIKECRWICNIFTFINLGLALLSAASHDSALVFLGIGIPYLVMPFMIFAMFDADKYCNKLTNPAYGEILKSSTNSNDFDVALANLNKEKEKQKRRIERRKVQREAREALIAEGVVFGDAAKRPTIPRDVVDAVWIRDKGRCVYCGSTDNLQLDHIIPFSKGGATTVENLQLLCQKCNIRKSNHIGNE